MNVCCIDLSFLKDFILAEWTLLQIHLEFLVVNPFVWIIFVGLSSLAHSSSFLGPSGGII